MEGDKESKSADIPASSSSAMDLADYAPPTHSSQQTGRAIEEVSLVGIDSLEVCGEAKRH